MQSNSSVTASIGIIAGVEVCNVSVNDFSNSHYSSWGVMDSVTFGQKGPRVLYGITLVGRRYWHMMMATCKRVPTPLGRYKRLAIGGNV
jgi:hypothetical protein